MNFFFCPAMDLFQLEGQDTGDFSAANFIDLIMCIYIALDQSFLT